MARFSDILRDQNGAPIGGALVVVAMTVTGDLASLTADSGGSLTNPLTSASNGSYYFNAPDGSYDLTFRYGGRVIGELLNTYVGLVSQLPAGTVANSLGDSTEVAPSQAAIDGAFRGNLPVTMFEQSTGKMVMGTIKLSGGVLTFVPS